MLSTNASDAVKAFIHSCRTSTPTYSEYVAVANAVSAANPAPLYAKQLRIAFLRNFTIEPLLPVLAGEVIRVGALPKFYVGDFDAIHSEVLNPASPLYAFDPHVIVLAQWLELLSPSLTTAFLACSPEHRDREYKRVRNHIREIILGIRARVKAPILLNNWPLPAYPTLGVLDAQSPYSQTETVIRLNADILSDVQDLGDVWIVDYLRLFATIGRNNAVDERYWQMAKAPLAKSALIPLGKQYGRFLAALLGASKKCLVLDCDNTLWGGIIGEDGLAGIAIGSAYPGSCYLDFQQEILNLRERGVIIALCSKNNEEDVLEVFREHPEMRLRLEHVTTWQINWDDKATNLRRIAATLNIGVDSIVFLDDSPFEIEYVREHLPEVTAELLPPQSSAFRATLAAGGWFDALTYTLEDRQKSELYRANRVREELKASSGSLGDYLESLKMLADIRLPSEADIARAAQLTQKTNQFNLTTRRYTETDIRSYAASAHSDVIILRLRDVIADMGLVGLAIVTYVDGVANMDSLLLSCRVIGRGVEDALLATLAQRILERPHVTLLRATYAPTKKNAIVAEFYDKHGFSIVAGSAPERAYVADRSLLESLTCPTWITVTNSEDVYAA